MSEMSASTTPSRWHLYGMRCRIRSKPQVNQLFSGLDLRHQGEIVWQWVLFQEPDNTMVVSFADAADHGATTLTAASAADRCMDLESNASGAFIRKCCARSLARKLVKQNDVCGRGVQLFHGFFCPMCKLIYLILWQALGMEWSGGEQKGMLCYDVGAWALADRLGLPLRRPSLWWQGPASPSGYHRTLSSSLPGADSFFEHILYRHEPVDIPLVWKSWILKMDPQENRDNSFLYCGTHACTNILISDSESQNLKDSSQKKTLRQAILIKWQTVCLLLLQ